MKNNENKAKNINKFIGNRIRQAREDIGYPQLDLAKALDFESSTAISLIESGERKVTAENLEKIAKTLKRDISFFIGEEEREVDVQVALRASKDISNKDKEAIAHFIEMARKKHGNG